ncbi:hypothetical protein Tco_1379888 [Tanacetum coccineum]
MQQKEETFQVVIDVIKNSTCFKAFTITVKVPEIFMQQFWYIIKKVKDSESYEFPLAHKKCIVDAEVFRKILNICPRVEGEEFTKVQDDDATFTFLIDLGYKGPLHKYTNMYVDHMHHPWRTLAAIINKCLSSKTASNDRESVDVFEESKPKPAKKKTGSRSTKGVVIQDPPSDPKPKPAAPKLKLKGTGGSNKGTGRIPGVPDESIVISATSHEGTGTKPGVPNEEKVISEVNVILEWGSENESENSNDSQLNFDDKEMKDKDGDADDEGDDHISDIHDLDDEDAETKSDEDEIYKYKIHVHKHEDEEMINGEVKESGNGDEENTDAAKTDAGKTEEVKDDAKKVSTIKDTIDAEINSLLDIKIQYEVPHIQSLSVLRVPMSVIFKPSVLTQVQETPSLETVTSLPLSSVSTIPPIPYETTTPIRTQPITTESPTITTAVPESNALFVVQLRVAKLEKDVSELKKIDHSRHTADIIQKYSMKPAPESSKIQKPIIDLEQESEKSASEIHKIKREQAKKQKMPSIQLSLPTRQHSKKALIKDENDMDKGVVDIVKNHKRQHDDDDDEDSSVDQTRETPKGKAQSKGSKTGKSASAKEPVEEPIVEVVMDDAFNTMGEYVVRDDDKLHKTSEPKRNKTLNQDWFEQPPRPPNLNPEWNKRQVVLD